MTTELKIPFSSTLEVGCSYLYFSGGQLNYHYKEARYSERNPPFILPPLS